MLWVSKMQSEISLLTLESEQIVISTETRDVIPIKGLIAEISKAFNLKIIKPKVKFTIFEDNNGASYLANAPKISQRNKHIAIKYHHFNSRVASEEKN